jgi:hypothetical protein
MAEHAVDNRETEDRNLYPLPSNNDITVSARYFSFNIIKYYTMKNILSTSLYFVLGLVIMAIMTSAQAQTAPQPTPKPETRDCSCGACE